MPKTLDETGLYSDSTTTAIYTLEPVDNLQNISTVARLLGVPAHTIRYWEKEFGTFLNPPRPNGGHRRYGNYEIEVLRRIKSMLKEEKYSIAGARQKFQSLLLGKSGEERQPPVFQMAETGNGRGMFKLPQ